MYKKMQEIFLMISKAVLCMTFCMAVIAESPPRTPGEHSERSPNEQGDLSIVLTGQALIQSDIRTAWPDAIAGIRPLLIGDVVFTNFESMIFEQDDSKDDLPPHDQGHHGPPEMFDVLAQMGFNLIATANNHAYDLMEKGIMSVTRNLEKRGLVYAGTGANLAKASAPGYLDTPKGRVALVATTTGFLRKDGAATDVKAGVNELRLEGGTAIATIEDYQQADNAGYAGLVDGAQVRAGTPVEEDAKRILDSIREARKNADLVISYHHNHLFDEDFPDLIGGISPNRYRPPEWIKDWSRRQIDAGADIVVIQGLPLVHGLEIYNGRPIFYDMGNFMFQLDVAWKDMFYPGVLKSVIANVAFDDGGLKSIEFSPIVISNDLHKGYERHLSGIPVPASGKEGQSILEHLAELSREFGTVMTIKDGKAVVNIKQSGSVHQ